MFKKSTLTTAFTAVALAVALTACGGGGGGSESAVVEKTEITGVAAGDVTVGSTAAVSGKLATNRAFVAPLSLVGSYGVWTFDAGTGTWTYKLDSIKAAAIPLDSTVTDALVVKTTDNAASTTVTVSIKGLAADSTIVTSVTAPTYAVGSEELAAFNLLNAERGRCGFGLLAQNTLLDAAAKAHADYQVFNTYLSHYEDSSLPLFTGITPASRIIAAGYSNLLDTSAGESSTENFYKSNKAGEGISSIRSLLNAPYHMSGMLVDGREIGIAIRTAQDVNGIYAGTASLYNHATTTMAGWQLQASSSINTYPCDGTTGTDYQLSDETPNPVPGRDLAASPLGSSVFVSVRRGQVLVINSATMQAMVNGAPSGSPEVVRPAVIGTSNGAYFLPHEGYITADAPMLPNTSYRVTIDGTNNGVSFKKDFTFTTGTGG